MKTIGKVIKILDKYSIIIDLGNKENVLAGDVIQVFVKGPEVINENHEVIGTLDFVKAELKVIISYENMSLCKKIEKVTEGNEVYSLFSNKMKDLVGTTVEQIKEIKVDEAEIDQKLKQEYEVLKEAEQKVKIGDLVKLIN